MTAPNGSPAPVSVALFGYGRWGQNLARVIAASASYHFAAIVEPDAERRALARMHHPVVKVLPDGAELMGNGSVEAAFVAVPPLSLTSTAHRALDDGLHVFVEKPGFSTSRATDVAAQRAKQAGCTLMFDHTDVHSPVTAALASALERSVAGRLRSWRSVRTNRGNGQPGTDVMRDLAIHDLACLDSLVTQRPSAVSATGESGSASNEVSRALINLHYPSGLCATIEADWFAPRRERQTEIIGDRGALVRTEAGGLAFAPAIPAACVVDWLQAPEILCPTPVRGTPNEPLARAVAQFARAIRSDAAVTTDAAQSGRILGWIEAAERSIDAGGQLVPLLAATVS